MDEQQKKTGAEGRPVDASYVWWILLIVLGLCFYSCNGDPVEHYDQHGDLERPPDVRNGRQ